MQVSIVLNEAGVVDVRVILYKARLSGEDLEER